MPSARCLALLVTGSLQFTLACAGASLDSASSACGQNPAFCPLLYEGDEVAAQAAARQAAARAATAAKPATATATTAGVGVGTGVAAGIGASLKDTPRAAEPGAEPPGPPPPDVCRTAIKILTQYERLAKKFGLNLPASRLNELNRLRDTGTITINHVPGTLRGEFPLGIFGDRTLDAIRAMCRM